MTFYTNFMDSTSPMNTTSVINNGVKKLVRVKKFGPRFKAPFWVAVRNAKKCIITVIFEHNEYNLPNGK